MCSSLDGQNLAIVSVALRDLRKPQRYIRVKGRRRAPMFAASLMNTVQVWSYYHDTDLPLFKIVKKSNSIFSTYIRIDFLIAKYVNPRAWGHYESSCVGLKYLLKVRYILVQSGRPSWLIDSCWKIMMGMQVGEESIFCHFGNPTQSSIVWLGDQIQVASPFLKQIVRRFRVNILSPLLLYIYTYIKITATEAR